MTQPFDEVRLTAYALGELDPAEAAEVEAFLSRNPAARREVEAIRAFCSSVPGALESEGPAPMLTDAQKARIDEAAGVRPWKLHPRADAGPGWRRYRPAFVAALSVFVVASGVLGYLWRSGRGGGGGGADRGMERNEVASGPRMETPQVAYELPLRDEIERKPMSIEALEEQKKDGRPMAGARISRRVLGLAAGERRAQESGEDPLSTEAYSYVREGGFVRAIGDDARSTFALDVDTASYSNVRRLLRQGQRPPKGAVRIEELVNYFAYDHPAPADGKPLAITVEVSQCPWAPSRRLAMIGLKAKSVERSARGRANLVFLIDVSGSMQPANKLPLVKRSLGMLLEQLRPDDRVALVVYAGASGLVLPSTAAGELAAVREAIERLGAGGSTNGGQGIELAYSVAKANFVDGGINRVILCTDGDFNVGTTSESSLVELIEAKAKTGVFLTVLGFGMGNLKDATLEKLANKGNGTYGYVDTEAEARRLLVEQADSTLVTVAKDARIQVEFNPAAVGAWRLIGYENRVMANRDFHDDRKDAGEVGAGHAVTALYEIIPAGSAELAKLANADPLRYQAQASAGAGMAGTDLMTVSLRYKEPDGDKSSLIEVPVQDGAGSGMPSADFRWASAVAMFGMELRGSEHKGLTNWALVDELARSAAAPDRGGLRQELLELVKLAAGLDQR